MKRLIATLALGLALSVATNAQTSRLAAFALNCDGGAGGVASFTVYLEHNVVFFGNSCHPGTGLLGSVPDIPDSYGNVVKLGVVLKTNNAVGKSNYCDFTSTNGFLNGTCLTNNANNGPIDAVHVLISIPNLP